MNMAIDHKRLSEATGEAGEPDRASGGQPALSGAQPASDARRAKAKAGDSGRTYLSEAEIARILSDLAPIAERRREVSRRGAAMLAGANLIEPDAPWYVLRLMPNAEKDVDNALKEAGLERWLPVEQIVPKRRGGMKRQEREKVTVPVWPGYIFVRVPNRDAYWAGLFAIDGVLAVLGGADRPSPVKDDIVLKLKLFLQHDDHAREVLSKALKAGDRVRVDDGPFASFEGLVTWLDAKCKSERVKVDVDIFGRSCPVDLDLAQVTRID